MATLVEAITYTPGIYQIETTDPVVGGEGGISNLQANQLANRTAWLNQQVAALGSGMPVRDQSRGLTVANNVATPNSRLDISAMEMILQNNAGVSLRATGVALTADITVAGVNGLDMGAVAISTWYHIWLISNSVQIASLLSLNPVAPALPAGYTYQAYAGAVYVNSSGNFITMKQVGKLCVISPVSAVIGLNSTVLSAASLGSIVPTTAKKVSGYLFAQTSGISVADIIIAGSSATLGEQPIGISISSGASPLIWSPFSLLLLTPQIIYASTNSSYCTVNIYVNCWEY